MSAIEPVEVPLTATDRKQLSYRSSRGSFGDVVPVALNTAFVAAILFSVLLAVWAFFIPFGNPFEHQPFILLVATLIAALGLREMWVDFFTCLRPSPDGPTAVDRDLAEGVAKVLTADVRRVVEIEEYDDEGPGFLLELADGRVLAVVSQDLYEFTHDAELEEGEEDTRDNFPQTRIEYRYAPHSGLHLGIRGVGEPLKPVGLVKTDKHHFVKSGRKGPRHFVGAEDGTFYEGTLEEVLARLKYTLRPLPTREAEDG